MKDFLTFLSSHSNEIWTQTTEHLYITLIAMGIGSAIGVLTGILLTRRERLASTILGLVGIIQTIPSLALLGFLLPIFGIGVVPAVIALFMYALLPIVRNTYTGIKEIDPAIKEAAKGMGMTNLQLLRYVEIPIAFPVILAGIRTATVINVGVATLCALIAAGGLGEFIFRGVTLNNSNMILAGAIPASALAITLDTYLGLVVKYARKKKLLYVLLAIPLIVLTISLLPSGQSSKALPIKAGFNSEFIYREDGYEGLKAAYNLPLEIKEMDLGLLYAALENKEVDIIEGFTTDGKMMAYDFVRIEDDKNYFPPYYAAPLVNNQILTEHPSISTALNKLDGVISDELMSEINFEVDENQKSLKEAAALLIERTLGIKTNPEAGLKVNGEIVIGSKAFTESYVLAHVFAQLIEYETGLTTTLKLGFGGTKLLFDALRTNEVQIYPEYTGTGLLVILDAPHSKVKEIIRDENAVYDYVNLQFKENYGISWLSPLGFNNTYAMLMRKEDAERLELQTLSDLAQYVNETLER